MTKFIHLAKKQNVAKKKLSINQLDLKKANIIIGVFIVIFGLGYVIEVNSLATKGYQIKELEQKVADLQQENADLQLDTLSLQSMGAVKDKVGQLKMVASADTSYLQANEVAMAR